MKTDSPEKAHVTGHHPINEKLDLHNLQFDFQLQILFSCLRL